MQSKTESDAVRQVGGAEARRMVEALSAALPDWFGLPEWNRYYAEGAAVRTGFAIGDAALLVVEPLYGRALELWWMAVRPARHRQGLGRRLVAAARGEAKRLELPLMAVRTLSPADPDPGYAATRAFYEAMGFRVTLPAGYDSPLVWMLADT